VRQHIVEQTAQILAARGPDTWINTIARLNQRLHLSPGLLEHHTLTESIDRDRNRAGYTKARLDELQKDARRVAVTLRDAATPTVRDTAAQSTFTAPRPGESPATGPGGSGLSR